MTKTFNGVTYTNIPDDLYGLGISDTIIQTNISAAGHSNRGSYLEDTGEDGNFYPLVHAIDIDWDGITIQNNTINNTSDLINWIDEATRTAPQASATNSGWMSKDDYSLLHINDFSNIQEQSNTSSSLSIVFDGKIHMIDSSNTAITKYNISFLRTDNLNHPTTYYIKVPETVTSIDILGTFKRNRNTSSFEDPTLIKVDLGTHNLNTGGTSQNPAYNLIKMVFTPAPNGAIVEYYISGYNEGLTGAWLE